MYCSYCFYRISFLKVCHFSLSYIPSFIQVQFSSDNTLNGSLSEIPDVILDPVADVDDVMWVLNLDENMWEMKDVYWLESVTVLRHVNSYIDDIHESNRLQWNQ